MNYIDMSIICFHEEGRELAKIRGRHTNFPQ